MSEVTTTAVAEVATPTRVITVISTVGTKKKDIEFPENLLWGDLKKVLGNNGYSLSNIKAVEGESKVTLEHEKAVLPDGNFFLFLMPYKSKSGAAKKEVAPKKAVPKKAAAKKAVKSATPKKAAAKKAAPKKAAAKKVAAKKATTIPEGGKLTAKSGPKVAKAKKVASAAEPTQNVADVVTSVVVTKTEKKILTDYEADQALRDLAKGFNDVRL